ncbi:MAG TPA: DinB family protein [Isosphaeraceae bacterium]|nr:DinB family protein [Isosphaeraceae bacterium]
MAAAMIDRFRRWFEYEQDAYAKVIASFDSVPEEKHSAPEFRKAVAMLAHIVAARHMWLGRLGVIPAVSGTMFRDDPDVDVDRVAADWQRVSGLWAEYLASLDDPAIDREFEYQSLDAGRFRNRIEDILAQLFGHSWYHRGQIAMLIRAAGGQPAVTDLIYCCREPISGPDAGDCHR